MGSNPTRGTKYINRTGVNRNVRQMKQHVYCRMPSTGLSGEPTVHDYGSVAESGLLHLS